MDLAERRRSEILDAAYKVFSEKGYHDAKIADIAAQLNMGHGTFYRYFENKLDIFNHVIGNVIQKLSVDVISAESPDTSNTLEEFRDQLDRIGRRLFDLFVANPQFSRLLFYEALGIDEETNEKIQAMFDLLGVYTEQYIVNGVNKGFLRQDVHTRETAFIINAILLEAARRVVTAVDQENAYEIWREAVMDLVFKSAAP
jgi:AcrR family transcriptional regulator